MKTVLDQATRDELTTRIASLTENSQAQWGQMNVHQMLKHCILCEEMYLGKVTYPRTFLGKIIGKLALKGLLKDENPMRRNSPTGPDFKVSEAGGNVAEEKAKWIELITEYGNYNKPEMVHWFFGSMTREQVGQLVYKHSDHHLRQFNA